MYNLCVNIVACELLICLQTNGMSRGWRNNYLGAYNSVTRLLRTIFIDDISVKYVCGQNNLDVVLVFWSQYETILK